MGNIVGHRRHTKWTQGVGVKLNEQYFIDFIYYVKLFIAKLNFASYKEEE